MLPGPCPLLAFSVSQPDSDAATHSHSRSVLIANVPEPPAAGTDDVLAVAVTAHRVMEGAVTLTSVDPPQPLSARRSPEARPVRRVRRDTNGARAVSLQTARLPSSLVYPPKWRCERGAGGMAETCAAVNFDGRMVAVRASVFRLSGHAATPASCGTLRRRSRHGGRDEEE